MWNPHSSILFQYNKTSLGQYIFIGALRLFDRILWNYIIIIKKKINKLKSKLKFSMTLLKDQINGIRQAKIEQPNLRSENKHQRTTIMNYVPSCLDFWLFCFFRNPINTCSTSINQHTCYWIRVHVSGFGCKCKHFLLQSSKSTISKGHRLSCLAFRNTKQ